MVAESALVGVEQGYLVVIGASVGSLDDAVARVRVVRSILDVGYLDLAGPVAWDN